MEVVCEILNWDACDTTYQREMIEDNEVEEGERKKKKIDKKVETQVK